MRATPIHLLGCCMADLRATAHSKPSSLPTGGHAAPAASSAYCQAPSSERGSTPAKDPLVSLFEVPASQLQSARPARKQAHAHQCYLTYDHASETRTGTILKQQIAVMSSLSKTVDTNWQHFREASCSQAPCGKVTHSTRSNRTTPGSMA